MLLKRLKSLKKKKSNLHLIPVASDVSNKSKSLSGVLCGCFFGVFLK